MYRAIRCFRCSSNEVCRHFCDIIVTSLIDSPYPLSTIPEIEICFLLCIHDTRCYCYIYDWKEVSSRMNVWLEPQLCAVFSSKSTHLNQPKRSLCYFTNNVLYSVRTCIWDKALKITDRESLLSYSSNCNKVGPTSRIPYKYSEACPLPHQI